jgi:hypothetical protein
MAITVDRGHQRLGPAPGERFFRYGTRLAAVSAYAAAVAVGFALLGPVLGREDATTVLPAAQAIERVKVQRGDTLELIAARNGVSVTRLLALNPGLEPLALERGARLRVR